VVDLVNCQAAYLAVRRGDKFRIEAIWNCSEEARGLQFAISENPFLQRLTLSGEGQIVTNLREAGSLIPAEAFPPDVQTWMGMPMVLGNRTIALLGIASTEKSAFQANDLRNLAHLSRQITPFVENALALDEAGRHLQRLALLNELASTASAGFDLGRVSNRVMRTLHRAFNTESISLLLVEKDGKTLREYGRSPRGNGRSLKLSQKTLPVSVVKTGMPLRIDDSQTAPAELGLDPQIGSELAVPLKYQGKVRGVLDLVSGEPNAFSPEDEQLLVVLASHLAGLLENLRLSEESQLRARNLGLIHQVVQRVVGLVNVEEIASRSAELMAERFGFELATILLVDSASGMLHVSGAGGAYVHLANPGAGIPLDSSFVGKIMQTGGSFLSNDLNIQDPELVTIGWNPRSRACVPLKEGETVFGLINVEHTQANAFSENDLIVLESLAGFLSSVLMNAVRYEELRSTVRHLQASRETSIDIGADLDLDTLLRRVVNRTRQLVGVKGAEIGLVEEEAEVIRVLVSENPWNDYSGLTFPLMSGVAGMVAALGEPLVVNDYNTWSGKMTSDRRAPFSSVAGVPLNYKGQVIGTLTVYDDQPERILGKDDVELLELVAPQVAVYIRHAKLYQELQERIEAQQLAERRLIQSARLAAVGEMAAGIAHEFNNPLTVISGFAELVLDEVASDFKQRPDIELILREANRARAVVRRLLDFSRQSESVRERLDINVVIDDVFALVKHLARTGGVEIQLELGEDLPLVYVDSNQMKQVLLNIIHNSLQAMPEGGVLKITSAAEHRNDRGWVSISVKDQGQGIPKENLDKIFEPFFTTKPTGDGTGLGLAISYGIISDHGGLLEVESEEGEGVLIKIWLREEVEPVVA
ncbi:MAG TPA: GAF domain-containing protein, partial [Anaerolineales bacterium]|nr:GAF domain-containing protein [Anaerolineales bacterium]